MFKGKKSIMNGSIFALIAILIVIVCAALGETIQSFGVLVWLKIAFWIIGFALAIVAVCVKQKVVYVIGVVSLIVGEAISVIATLISIGAAFKGNVILGLDVLCEAIGAVLIVILLAFNLATCYTKDEKYTRAIKPLGYTGIGFQCLAALLVIIYYAIEISRTTGMPVEEMVAVILGAVAGALMYIVIALGHVYVGGNPNKLEE